MPIVFTGYVRVIPELSYSHISTLLGAQHLPWPSFIDVQNLDIYPTSQLHICPIKC